MKNGNFPKNSLERTVILPKTRLKKRQKYAKGNVKVKILECFDSIASQLSKENKKFQYSVVKKGSKARDYDGCLEWLVDAGIVVKCKNLSALELPLDGNAIRYKNECVPIEIKAQTGNAKSIRTVLKNEDVYHINNGIKFGDYNIGKEGKLLTAPLYTLFLLDEHMNE